MSARSIRLPLPALSAILNRDGVLVGEHQRQPQQRGQRQQPPPRPFHDRDHAIDTIAMPATRAIAHDHDDGAGNT